MMKKAIGLSAILFGLLTGCSARGPSLADLPTAPESQRVDLAEPTFSDPTAVSNPLFPIGELQRVILLGTVDGLPFRSETTLLAETKPIEWNGQTVKTLVSQYAAFSDGRIHEVALDWYAQADDGSVWYLGEDVFNYEAGVVADTGGTWLAGQEGPAAMIMPGNPQAGDVYRPENAPGVVFEEVTVKSIGQTVHGPLGPIDGAIVTQELHMDGTTEGKIFAPGYGEFLTGAGGDLEAAALAVPFNALGGPVPEDLVSLSSAVRQILEASQVNDWSSASASLDAVLAAWDFYRTGNLPRLLEAQMSSALVELVAAVDAQQPPETGQAAIAVAMAVLDFELRHRPVSEIDLALFDLWAARVGLDAAAGDPANVAGDVATLEWIRDRFVHALASADAESINALLGDLRTAADGEDLRAAADSAGQLRDLVSGLMG
jgi:hypothetical protein